MKERHRSSQNKEPNCSTLSGMNQTQGSRSTPGGGEVVFGLLRNKSAAQSRYEQLLLQQDVLSERLRSQSLWGLPPTVPLQLSGSGCSRWAQNNTFSLDSHSSSSYSWAAASHITSALPSVPQTNLSQYKATCEDWDLLQPSAVQYILETAATLSKWNNKNVLRN